MRTTIISKSKNRGSSKQRTANGWTLAYENRFIGTVRKVRGAAECGQRNIKVQNRGSSNPAFSTP